MRYELAHRWATESGQLQTIGIVMHQLRKKQHILKNPPQSPFCKGGTLTRAAGQGEERLSPDNGDASPSQVRSGRLSRLLARTLASGGMGLARGAPYVVDCRYAKREDEDSDEEK